MRFIFASLAAVFVSPIALAAAEHGDAAAHEHSSGLPQLDFSTYPSQVFWLAIMFVVLYVFFSKWTLPALSVIIESRAQHIKSDLDAATKLKNEAQSVKDSYEASLSDARHKASVFFAQAEEKAKENAKACQEDFRKDSAKRIAAVEASIAAARDEALLSIEEKADDLAASVVKKVLKG